MDHTTQPEPANALRILSTLAEIGPCHVVKLAALLDAHPIFIDRSCDRLQQDGQLRRQHGGVYAITDAGVTMLENVPREQT
jgi:DeoR/GlpR family transcriptional regulator of sugar metabolism